MANMPPAAAIRNRIEIALAERVPAALTPKIRQVPEQFSTGVASVDQMLGGGIPRGGITEVCGPASAGRTSLALACISSVTRLGNACAWVDVSDALSPESMAAAGVQLRRLLWLRMSGGQGEKTVGKPWARLERALRSTDLLLQAGGFAAVVLDMSDVPPQQTMRVPLSTWYRFRLAAEQGRTALLFLTQSSCASSCAALALRCEAAQSEPFSHCGETPLFERLGYQLVRERNRHESSPFLQKKPVARVAWVAETLWVRCR